MSPSSRRTAAVELQSQFAVSERRACAVLDQPRSTQRYRGRPRSDEAALCRRLRELVRRRPRFGYRRLTAVLRRERWRVNRKRVHRLCRKEGLKVRRIRRKTRSPGRSANACHVRRAEHKDHVWCWDFAFDRTESGTTVKWLSIVDEHTRECLRARHSGRAVRDAGRAAGDPLGQRPGFVAQSIQGWLGRLGIETRYIAPGSPWENGYAESFHSKLVDEFLSRETFASVVTARQLTTA